MKILVEMNLSPGWVELLNAVGHEACHWSSVGDPRAADAQLMRWASEQDQVILTSDLDFSAILAASGGNGPSVVQLRGNDVLPQSIGPAVVRAPAQFEPDIAQGALVSVSPAQARARVLPL